VLDRPANPIQEKPAARPAVAREFQTPALALEDDAPPRVLIWLLLVLTALVVAATAFAIFARVDEVVVTQGQLVTTVPTVVVQPLETVMVKSIEAKVGDIVRKGQVLATLDPTFAEADVRQLQSKVTSYAARAARLEAEFEARDYAADASSSESQRIEASLFDKRKLEYTSQMNYYGQEVGRYEADAASARDELVKNAASIELLKRIVSMREKLAETAYGSQLQLIDSRNQLLTAERDAVQIQGKIEEFGHQLQGAIAQRDAYAQQWRAKTADELVSVRRDLVAAREDLDKALRRRDMVDLTAPTDAVVLDLAKRSTGSVLRSAEPLFTLVPLDAPLEAEVRIGPKDIGRLHDGEEVRIKLDAFPFQRHGTLDGRIKTISADTFQPGGDGQDAGAQQRTGAPYYRARVALLDTHLLNMPADARLLPGMTVTAEIKVGRRRIISYLLYPVLKGLDESMREP
jgi:HlyD family secretion protein